MQYNPVATKIAILQPNIGVGQGLIPSSVAWAPPIAEADVLVASIA
jgi:hypothetical protein